MIYSHSRLETFKSCKKKFYYNYINKPDIEKKNSIEAFLGSMVHLALEKLYNDLNFKKLNTLEELLIYYNQKWDELYNPNEINIVRDQYSPDNYKEMGLEHITNYYNRYKPFDQGKTIGIETKLDIKFFDKESDTLYNLTGFIDRLVLISDDYMEIHDYKTNRVPKNQLELDQDKQLALYQIAIHNMYPNVKKIDLVWHFLNSDLEMRSKRSQEDLINLEKEIIETIKEIEKTIEEGDYPTTPSALCDWCEFKEICPATSHSQKLKKLSENEFLNEPGVKLVDLYRDLDLEKKQFLEVIDKKIDDLKEAIIKYSEDNNVERLTGSTTSLLVRSYDSLKFPSKDTKEKAELDQLFRDNNLWDAFSDIGYMKVINGLKDSFFSEEFSKKVKALLKEEKIYRFYQNKKRY